jgi:putative ABC transport system ATP-binding protein
MSRDLSTAFISVVDASLVYGTGTAAVQAVDQVNLEIRGGDLLLLMGPSGSGKTSLLQMIGGLIRPTSGRILVDGRPINALGAQELSAIRLRKIGFVFQHYNLFQNLRAWENVAVTFELLGFHRIDSERASRALLERMDIAHRADAFPHELSGGQKQRVAIARALAGNPDVLLADEPTAALDTQSGERIGTLLRDLAHQDGRAVVIVTHDRRLAAVADHTILLEDGRIVDANGAPTLRKVAGSRR